MGVSKKNREYQRIWAREYRKKYPKRVKLARIKYDEANHEKIKEYRKQYEKTDKAKERSKRYRDKIPEKIKERNAKQCKKQIVFKGKCTRLKENPRKGICQLCGRSVHKGEIKYTNLHHFKYDSKNPLANTIELCVRCHNTQAIVECVNVLELAVKR